MQLFQLEQYLQTDSYYYFHRTKLKENMVSPIHSHDFYECFWVESGEVSHQINDNVQALSAGQLVLIRPEDQHCFDATAKGGANITNLAFPRHLIDQLGLRYASEFAQKLFWQRELVPTVYQLENSEITLLKSLSLELEKNNKSRARVEGFLLTMLSILTTRAETLYPNLPAWLSQAMSRAKEPSVFRRGAAGLVAEAGRGHEHVCRKMKQYVGISPSEFINGIRMEHAGKLLITTEMKVEAVAEECGIENLSHFYNLFKRKHAITPNEFRLRYRLDLVASTTVEA